MADYRAMIRSAFEMGSAEDARSLFEVCVVNAFPTSSHRKLELIRFDTSESYMEGRSLNHVFEVRKTEYQNHPVWSVSPDKHAYLDYLTLDFLA